MTNSTTDTTPPPPAAAADSMCFLCRFDLGFQIGDLNAGALGLILLATILVCFCSLYTCGLYFCWHGRSKPEYAALAADKNASSDSENTQQDLNA